MTMIAVILTMNCANGGLALRRFRHGPSLAHAALGAPVKHSAGARVLFDSRIPFTGFNASATTTTQKEAPFQTIKQTTAVVPYFGG